MAYREGEPLPDGDESAAFRQGREAFMNGLALDANPHTAGSGLAEAWEVGWISAAEDTHTP